MTKILLRGTSAFALTLIAGSVSFAAGENQPQKARVPVQPSRMPAQRSTQNSVQKPIQKLVQKPAAQKTVQRPVLQTKLPAKRNLAAQKKPASTLPDSLLWTKNTSGWTRIVRASDSSSGQAFSESLSLALDGQYLVVPWSFVSEVSLARPGARFYFDEPKQEAFLVDLDIAANLALLKAERPLIPSFVRSQLRLGHPLQDESLLVLASRDWIRAGARFLRAKIDGTSARYQIALGQGDFSSARFIFDRAGRLVAVSSNGDQGERLWSGPASAVFTLLQRQDGPKPASIPAGDQRRRQLYNWQDRWARALVPTKSALSLSSLDCQSYLASITDQALAIQIKSVRALDCQGQFPMQLGGGYTTGVRLWTGEAALRPTEEGTSKKLVQAFAHEAFGDLDRSAALVNLMTVPECSENTVLNKRGQHVHVRFCTTALKVEPGLSDTAISVSATEAGTRAYFTVARLKGFDQMSTKKVMESLVENVRGVR